MENREVAKKPPLEGMQDIEHYSKHHDDDPGRYPSGAQAGLNLRKQISGTRAALAVCFQLLPNQPFIDRSPSAADHDDSDQNMLRSSQQQR